MTKESPTEAELKYTFQLEEMRLKYAGEAQTRRLTFASSLVSTVLSAMTLYMQYTNNTEMTATKKEVVAVKTEAKAAKEEAKSAADAVVVSSERRDVRLDRQDAKLDANLMQWKAYTTKEPEDMNRAEAALKKVESATDP